MLSSLWEWKKEYLESQINLVSFNVNRQNPRTYGWFYTQGGRHNIGIVTCRQGSLITHGTTTVTLSSPSLYPTETQSRHSPSTWNAGEGRRGRPTIRETPGSPTVSMFYLSWTPELSGTPLWVDCQSSWTSSTNLLTVYFKITYLGTFTTRNRDVYCKRIDYVPVSTSFVSYDTPWIVSWRGEQTPRSWCGVS